MFPFIYPTQIHPHSVKHSDWIQVENVTLRMILLFWIGMSSLYRHTYSYLTHTHKHTLEVIWRYQWPVVLSFDGLPDDDDQDDEHQRQHHGQHAHPLTGLPLHTTKEQITLCQWFAWQSQQLHTGYKQDIISHCIYVRILHKTISLMLFYIFITVGKFWEKT